MKRAISAHGRRVEYTLIQSVRQSVLFQALPEQGIRVYAPRGMRLGDVDRMVRERADQLLEMQRQVDAKLDADRRAHPVTDGSPILVEGRPRALRLAKGSRITDALAEETYALSLPRPGDDAAVRSALRAALSRRALERIRARLAYYAPRIGVTPGRIAIRDQKTRWGSCSSKGNLNFNWKLIMAPPRCLDYVVIHELCHLAVFNHSPRFWAMVAAQMPDYEPWKKWLKTHAGDLYL